jgi:hypothetical protein
LASFAAAAVNLAVCSPIVYSFTGSASGTLGTTAFSNASFTVTSAGDTSLVTLAPGSIYQVQVSSSMITIAGLPSATFLGPTYWGDPQGSGDIIFGNSPITIGTGLLGITRLMVGLETYNLESSFGPVFSPVDFESSIFMNFQNIATSQGGLTLVASNETFTATAAATPTPEPLSLLLLGVGLVLLPVARKVSTG